jgi:hypothetical protein
MKPSHVMAATLSLLCAAGVARAELVVYKTIERTTSVGFGTKTRLKTKAFLAMDWTTSEIMTISTFREDGIDYFTIDSPSDLVEYNVITKANSRHITTYTYVTRYSERTSGDAFTELSDFIKGRDVLLSISPWQQIIYPKGFTGAPRGVTRSSNGATAFEGRTTYLFDKNLTYTSNINDIGLQELIDSLRDYFLANGYVERPVSTL